MTKNEKIGAAIKKAWARPDSKFHSEQFRNGIRKRAMERPIKPASKERMKELRAMRDQDELNKKNSAVQKAIWEKRRGTKEFADKIENMVKVCRGSHGFGRNQLGRPDHTSAKFWVIRDPAGRVYECSNLRAWIRENIGLFTDYRPKSKISFPLRIFFGIANLGNGRKNRATAYYGWTLVSVQEAQNESRDLLGRDEAEMVLNQP